MTRCYRLLVGSITLLGLVTSALADAPPGRYTFPASGTVYDTRTQLTWQQVVPTAPVAAGCSGMSCTQAGALAYCTGLSLAGSGWRLPKVRELLTLVDRTRSAPAIDPTAFPSTPVGWFWSSSPYVGLAGNAWGVYFYGGNSGYDGTSDTNRVRCVR